MEAASELADLPVNFISGYGRDETIARALEAGAEDYLAKPFSPTELVAAGAGGPAPTDGASPPPGRCRYPEARHLLHRAAVDRIRTLKRYTDDFDCS